MLKNGLAIVVVLAAAAAADEDALSGPCRDARLVGPGERGGRAIDKYEQCQICLLYTSPSPRDGLLSRMPSSA